MSEVASRDGRTKTTTVLGVGESNNYYGSSSNNNRHNGGHYSRIETRDNRGERQDSSDNYGFFNCGGKSNNRNNRSNNYQIRIKGNCWSCGKPGHREQDCWFRSSGGTWESTTTSKQPRTQSKSPYRSQSRDSGQRRSTSRGRAPTPGRNGNRWRSDNGAHASGNHNGDIRNSTGMIL